MVDAYQMEAAKLQDAELDLRVNAKFSQVFGNGLFEQDAVTTPPKTPGQVRDMHTCCPLMPAAPLHLPRPPAKLPGYTRPVPLVRAARTPHAQHYLPAHAAPASHPLHTTLPPSPLPLPTGEAQQSVRGPHPPAGPAQE